MSFTNKTLERLLDMMNLNNESSLLDIGCGLGFVIFTAIEKYHIKSAHGWDMIPEFIEQCNQWKKKFIQSIENNNSNIEFQQVKMFEGNDPPLPNHVTHIYHFHINASSEIKKKQQVALVNWLNSNPQSNWQWICLTYNPNDMISKIDYKEIQFRLQYIGKIPCKGRCNGGQFQMYIYRKESIPI